MAAKTVDEFKFALRFSDLPAESRRMLPPIQGYESMPLVTLEEAVEPLMSLIPDVERMTWTVKQSHFDGEHNLTDDESASILLYTMEWEPRDKSFYIILNKTLQATNRNLLKPWFLYLRLIMTSLAKLPSDSHQLTVYRGVKLDLSTQYAKGSTITWWGFSSCTTSVEVLNDEQFLGSNGTRTLFAIECQSAKSIKSFSFHPEEEEVLLPPGRQFQVMGCLNQGNGFRMIQMKEIQPKFPLINPVPQPPLIPSKPKPEPIPPPPSVKPQPIPPPPSVKPEPILPPSSVKSQPIPPPSSVKPQPIPPPPSVKPQPIPPPPSVKPEPILPPSSVKPQPIPPPPSVKPEPILPPSSVKSQPIPPPSSVKPQPIPPPPSVKPQPIPPPPSVKPEPILPPSSVKPQPIPPPPSVKASIETLTPPNCGDPKLKKYIDALYLDPVIISF